MPKIDKEISRGVIYKTQEPLKPVNIADVVKKQQFAGKAQFSFLDASLTFTADFLSNLLTITENAQKAETIRAFERRLAGGERLSIAEYVDRIYYGHIYKMLQDVDKLPIGNIVKVKIAAFKTRDSHPLDYTKLNAIENFLVSRYGMKSILAIAEIVKRIRAKAVEVDLNHCKLTYENLLNFLNAIASKNQPVSVITGLKLDQCFETFPLNERMVDAITNCEQLTSLSLGKNRYLSKNAQIALLQRLKSPLKELSLRGNIVDADILANLPASLQSLDLSSCDLNGKGEIVRNTIARLNMHNLKLANCNLGEADILSVLNSLFFQENLDSLDLAGNLFSKSASSRLVGLIMEQNLQHLNIAGCKIVGDEFENICLALSVNKTLRSFNLQDIELNDEKMTKLAWALRRNHSLEKISLDFSGISEGLLALASVISENRTLKSISFTSHIAQRHSEGLTALAQAIASNLTLEKFDLACPIISDHFQEIQEAFKINDLVREKLGISSRIKKRSNLELNDESRMARLEAQANQIVRGIVPHADLQSAVALAQTSRLGPEL